MATRNKRQWTNNDYVGVVWIGSELLLLGCMIYELVLGELSGLLLLPFMVVIHLIAGALMDNSNDPPWWRP